MSRHPRVTFSRYLQPCMFDSIKMSCTTEVEGTRRGTVCDNNANAATVKIEDRRDLAPRPHYIGMQRNSTTGFGSR